MKTKNLKKVLLASVLSLGLIFFIGCKEKGDSSILKLSHNHATGYPVDIAYKKFAEIIERWPGGMLTNFPTIRKAVKKMTTIDKLTADGTYSNLSKREILQISRQRAKLDKTLGSIADLTRLPSALFVIDVMKENIAVREANRLGIPVFGIVDTNSDPTNIDFVIPANDDATKSVEVILDACCAAMIEGLEERKAEKIDMEAAGEAPANKGKKKSAKARLDKSDEEAINAAKAAAFLKEDEEA